MAMEKRQAGGCLARIHHQITRPRTTARGRGAFASPEPTAREPSFTEPRERPITCTIITCLGDGCGRGFRIAAATVGLFACAQGDGSDAASSMTELPSFMPIVARGPRGDRRAGMETEQSHPSACELGQSRPCACLDGGMGGRQRCEPDSESPLDGFYVGCEGCVPAPPSANMDAALPVDAGAPDAAGTDANVPDGSFLDDVADPSPSDAAEDDGCDDGRQNGEETDIDCGGACEACEVGRSCQATSDCMDGSQCDNGRCETGTATFRNYDHGSYTYANDVAWTCRGTTRLDSNDGRWIADTSCSNSEQERPQITCDVAQTSAGGPEVCILRAASFELGPNHRLELVGSRPVILAVDGDATIAGTIDASARGDTPGAGGNWNCEGSAGSDGTGDNGPFAGSSGGGGGGFRTAGGAGGTADTDNDGAPGGAGGQPRGDGDLSPLLGGCSGGRPGDCNQTEGGAAGGAMQITAAGSLIVTGTIVANGGDGATCTSGSNGGGAGGGAGGAILLEGGDLDTSRATLQANGGAGGGNGSAADNYDCQSDTGGAGSTSQDEAGGDGRDCEAGSVGGGGGYGYVVH